MKKKTLFIFVLLASLFVGKTVFGQNNSNSKAFKAVFFEKDYAVYGYSDGMNPTDPFVPKKLYLFEEDPTGFLVLDTVITIDCHSFTLRIPLRKYIRLAIDVVDNDWVKGKGSSTALAMAAPPGGGSGSTHTYEGRTDLKVEKFELKKKYSVDQFNYNLQGIDEFNTVYGKKDILALSSYLYHELKNKPKEQKFTDFLIESKAHPFEKMVLMQNQMNLFLNPDEFSFVFKKTMSGDDLPPLWQMPAYCDTNLLKQLAFYTPIFGGQCTGSWAEIFQCFNSNPLFEAEFNKFVKQNFREWINYRENCIIAKNQYEDEECKCQKVIDIGNGELGYHNKSIANKSKDGIMPSDVQNPSKEGGGLRWGGPNDIGGNTFDKTLRNDNDIRYIFDGNDNGPGGWYRYRSIVNHGDCSPVFESGSSQGDTATGTSTLYFQNAISYHCYDANTELRKSCACPVTIIAAAKHKVDMSAISIVQGNCNPLNIGSRFHRGSLTEASIATFSKINFETAENVLFKPLDVGRASVASDATSLFNLAVLPKISSLVRNSIKTGALVGAAIAGSGNTNWTQLDSALAGLVDSAIGLASSKFSYDTVRSLNVSSMLVDVSYPFQLYPNEEATLRLDNFHNALYSGESGGGTTLQSSRSFMCGFISNASRNNLCCHPAFATATHVGMQMEQNAFLNRIGPKGGNTSTWSTNASCVLWGGNYFGLCGDTGTYVAYKVARSKNVYTPCIDYIGNYQLRLSNFLEGVHSVSVYSYDGKMLERSFVAIEKDKEAIASFGNYTNVPVIIKVESNNYHINKKIMIYE
jgi:hypothetical protein